MADTAGPEALDSGNQASWFAKLLGHGQQIARSVWRRQPTGNPSLRPGGYRKRQRLPEVAHL
jgi:hypothetical protein